VAWGFFFGAGVVFFFLEKKIKRMQVAEYEIRMSRGQRRARCSEAPRLLLPGALLQIVLPDALQPR
jgi:hypothetical protein